MKTQFYFVYFALLSIIFSSSCKDDDSSNVKAGFTYTTTETLAGEVQFLNCSENATSYKWDFGDGETSTEKDPKHTFEGKFPFNVTLIALNGKESDMITQKVTSEIMVYKPNIYIYPAKSLDLSVTINFPQGGNIVQSIPTYNNGWFVHVEPTGKINNQYDYLFYESKQPNVFQYQKGWCIAKADLKPFFEQNMGSYNFSASEIKDFTDYWIPLLNDANYYCVYPQTNEIIDQIIQLNFSTKPHHGKSTVLWRRWN